MHERTGAKRGFKSLNEENEEIGASGGYERMAGKLLPEEVVR